jgi:hypothetical protein
MSRTNVKVEMPANKPDEMTALADKVVAHDSEMGTESPLVKDEVAALKAKNSSAKDKRERAEKMHAEAESLNQQGLIDIGVAKGQDSKTAGTVYTMMTNIRDTLLIKYKGQEERLSEWGYKVVITSSSGGGKAKAKE